VALSLDYGPKPDDHFIQYFLPQSPSSLFLAKLITTNKTLSFLQPSEAIPNKVKIGKMSRKDFLLCPESGAIVGDETSGFEFGDDVKDISEDDSSDEESEDSMDTFTENETSIEVSKADAEFLTPVNLKPSFARTLQAKSSARPSSTSTPSVSKRPAPSPAESNKAKKASKFPKKKSV
jgi:hypothetical protein